MERGRETGRARTAREDSHHGAINPHTFWRSACKEGGKAAELALAGAVVSGLAAVFLSTEYLTRFPHGEVILPWQFPIWAIASFVATGLLLFACIILRPAMFWPLLVGTAVLTAGIFVLRFPIFDEWLVACIVAGGFIAGATGFVPRRKRLGHPVWVIGFLALGLHLLLMSFIGIFAYGNLKAIRFSMVFLVVLVLGLLLAQYDFPRPAAQSITLLIAWTSLVYYVMYILHGLVFLSYVKTTILEGIGFAGSGHQTAPGMVAAPAALILIGRDRGGRRALGGAVLIMALLVTALGDSRGGMMAILGAMLVAPIAIGFIRSLKIAIVGVAASVLIGAAAFEQPGWILDIGEGLIGALNIEGGTSTYEYFGRQVTAARGDAGRFLYVRSSVEALLSENPLLTITGAGFYGYFPVAGRYVEEVAGRYGIPTFIVNYGSSFGDVVEPPRPPALAALIVETGIIGMALLVVCSVAAISTTVFRRSRSNGLRFSRGPAILVAASVALALVWSYFGEIEDMILFYLLIMPFGLVHTWGRMDKRGRSVLVPALTARQAAGAAQVENET